MIDISSCYVIISENKEENIMTFGEKMYKLRKAQGLSQWLSRNRKDNLNQQNISGEIR